MRLAPSLPFRDRYRVFPKRGKDLTDYEGIGGDLAGKIEEIVKTGGVKQLEEIHARTPQTLADLLKLEGLGLKRVKKFYNEINVTNWEELKVTAEEGELRIFEGLGPKTEQKILDELEKKGDEEDRTNPESHG